MSLGKNIAIVAGVWVGLNVAAFVYLSIKEKKRSVDCKPTETEIDKQVEELASGWLAAIDAYESTCVPFDASTVVRLEASWILRNLRKEMREGIRKILVNGPAYEFSHKHRMDMLIQKACQDLVKIGLPALP